MASRGRSWFVFLGTVSADIAFEWTVEATAFQTRETACAKAGDRRQARSRSKEVSAAGGQGLRSPRRRQRADGGRSARGRGLRKAVSLSRWSGGIAVLSGRIPGQGYLLRHHLQPHGAELVKELRLQAGRVGREPFWRWGQGTGMESRNHEQARSADRRPETPRSERGSQVSAPAAGGLQVPPREQELV